MPAVPTPAPIPPPPPPRVPAPPPSVPAQIEVGSVGTAFGGRGPVSRVPCTDDASSVGQASISTVSINGRPFNQAVFDANDNRLN